MPPAPGDIYVNVRLGIAPVPAARARVSPAEYTVIGGKRVKTKSANRYNEAAYEEYKNSVGWELRRARVAVNETDRLGVHAVFHVAVEDECDTDNLLKAILDACNKIAYRDDRQVKVVTAEIVEGVAAPHVDLVVYVIERRARKRPARRRGDAA